MTKIFHIILAICFIQIAGVSESLAERIVQVTEKGTYRLLTTGLQWMF